MSDAPNVKYDKFITLGDLDLCHYMEPLIIDSSTRVSQDVLDRMLAELLTYDEYHLVYAIELGSKHSPSTFAPHLPNYLINQSPAVWSAAVRNLDALADQYVTHELIESVRRIGSSNPANAEVAEILDKLEARLRKKEM